MLGLDESLSKERQEQEQGPDEGLRIRKELEDSICGAKGRMEVEREIRRAREDMEARREVQERRRRGHECPVPKPGGWVGGLLGFREEGKGSGVGDSEKGGRGGRGGRGEGGR